MDSILLSRLQFAFTITYHFIWPIITIGLITFLIFIEMLYLKTKNESYKSIYKLWSKIFAIGFGMGVVTGIPLSYQFGTNFAPLMKFAGSILGPLLSIEILVAFFLEATFIGVMLFGWGKVKPWFHMLATILVGIGVHNSAFWILAANSWMQTPQGYGFLADGTLYPSSWKEIIFSASMPIRFFHVIVATYLSVAILVFCTTCSILLKKGAIDPVKKCMKFCSIYITILAVSQLILGDIHGLNTLKHQPAKIAAIEGAWETQKGAPLILFAIPDQKNMTNHAEISIPNLASIILTHKKDGEIKGLKELEKTSGIPGNVLLVFFSFRIMVGLGLCMLLIGLISNYKLFRNTLYDASLFHRITIFFAPAGLIATLSGWWVTEIGRQPWLIYNLLLTKDSVSNVAPGTILSSFIAFIIVYSVITIPYLYYFIQLIKKSFSDYKEDEQWLKVATKTSRTTT